MSFTTPHKPFSTDQGHSRGYLPHEHLHRLQFITFRLHDSVPTELMEQWCSERATIAPQEDTPRWIQLNQLIEEYADSGHGACYLKDERIARLVIDALKKNDEILYLLHCWCVMPNHVVFLVLMKQGVAIPPLKLKSISQNLANRIRDIGRIILTYIDDTDYNVIYF